ncbi:hypothetical protein BDP27DRAFT_103870 [Rhodocollybia butyracea]|uniref:Uncharacterized protein n=1 Tax=Rhodocollybia butyracea TaxID=206335 RepID=A0A9P5PGQ3_9AGAR|nr:hypothetical protein BDP27DRAFT_103870 [Rhodocollybia butyracea]
MTSFHAGIMLTPHPFPDAQVVPLWFPSFTSSSTSGRGMVCTTGADGVVGATWYDLQITQIRVSTPPRLQKRRMRTHYEVCGGTSGGLCIDCTAWYDLNAMKIIRCLRRVRQIIMHLVIVGKPNFLLARGRVIRVCRRHLGWMNDEESVTVLPVTHFIPLPNWVAQVCSAFHHKDSSNIHYSKALTQNFYPL